MSPRERSPAQKWTTGCVFLSGDSMKERTVRGQSTLQNRHPRSACSSHSTRHSSGTPPDSVHFGKGWVHFRREWEYKRLMVNLVQVVGGSTKKSTCVSLPSLFPRLWVNAMCMHHLLNREFGYSVKIGITPDRWSRPQTKRHGICSRLQKKHNCRAVIVGASIYVSKISLNFQRNFQH